VGVLASVVVACAGGSDDRPFDPSVFDRSCSVDTDCVLVAPIVKCHDCCGNDQAVRDTESLRSARREANASCYSRSTCAMDCMTVAVCVNGTCEKTTKQP